MQVSSRLSWIEFVAIKAEVDEDEGLHPGAQPFRARLEESRGVRAADWPRRAGPQ